MPPTGKIYNSTVINDLKSVKIKYLILMSGSKLDFIWAPNINIKEAKFQTLKEFREDLA